MIDVSIIEVGPRDGLQNEQSIIDINSKLEFIRLLSLTGLKTIEVTSFVKPDKIPQMADSKELYSKLNSVVDLNDIRTPCLVPNLKGLDTAKELGVKEIALFTATSDTFNQKNINATVDESFIRLKEVADQCGDIKKRGYISTAFGCPYEGSVSIKKTLNVIEKLLKLGVFEISIGDTIGVANPKQVKEFCKELTANFDESIMAMHFHDTEGMALANILASYECGIKIFDSSAAGLGGCPYAKGATGNVATDDVVNMFEKMGVSTGVDQQKLHEASKYILSKLGKASPSKFFNAYEGRSK